ncbi:MAG: metallophosphatase family protein [Candidatus Pacebacteria bacterium]|jgi:hypothetical protein|nr:metallophosphatase family protein [Candidatus Paceibacterota bacterium]
MKIAIISDTHDNLARLGKFLAYAANNSIEAVVHCGDIAEGETLGYLAKNFDGKIYAAFGNMCYRDSVRRSAKKLGDKVALFEDFGQVELDGLNLGFCHFIEEAKRNCKTNRFDFVFYGHSHKPWMEQFENCILANPGNLAGLIFKSSFAVLDTSTKKLELKITDQL